MRTRSLVATTLSCVLLVGASATVSAQDDPQQVLAQALQATSAATSFHFLATADGAVNLGPAMGDTAMPITGTKAEGDVSVNPQGVQVTFEVPLFGLPISGGLILPADGSMYIKLALPMPSSNDLWHKVSAAGLPLDIGASPAPGGSPAPGASDMAAKLQQAITESGAVLTNEGNTPCASGTCTRLHLEIPAAAVEDRLGSLLPAQSPAPSMAPAVPTPVDILVDTTTSLIDSISAHVVDAATGTDLTIAVALSDYNAPVTITAPPADQVTDAPLFGR